MHPQDEYSTPTRAQQVWSHFSGLFGADAIKRKYGATPPAVWESELSFLTDAQLRSGLQRLVGAGGEHVPTLPQFLTMCRSSREFETSDAPRIAGPMLDRWAIASNQHLLARVLKYPKRYAPDSTYNTATHQAEPGPLTRVYTQILVAWKNSWADDMRADDKGDGLSIELQQAAWADCMARADEQIADVRSQKQEAA